MVDILAESTNGLLSLTIHGPQEYLDKALLLEENYRGIHAQALHRHLGKYLRTTDGIFDARTLAGLNAVGAGAGVVAGMNIFPIAMGLFAADVLVAPFVPDFADRAELRYLRRRHWTMVREFDEKMKSPWKSMHLDDFAAGLDVFPWSDFRETVKDPSQRSMDLMRNGILFKPDYDIYMTYLK